MVTDCQKPSRSDALRLHKYLSRCGLGSRRACEKIIAEGRVSVNGHPITQQGVTIRPSRDVVLVDGRRPQPERRIYLLFNKPRDVLCTCRDPQGRRTFADFLPKNGRRLYPVGRLDRNSEGLLLLTNDGSLALRLTHPRFGIQKTYRVWTAPALSADHRARLLAGVESEGERLKAVEVRPVPDAPECNEIVLKEGRKHQVRRMIEAVGARVVRLKRTALGPLTLGRLRLGQWRELTRDEVALLRQATSAKPNPAFKGRTA